MSSDNPPSGAAFDPRRRALLQALGEAGLLSGCCVAPVDRIGGAQRSGSLADRVAT